MQVIPDHKIVFTHVGGEPLPDIINPSYIYKKGDRFMLYYFDPDTEDNKVQEFEVTGVLHEVHSVIDGEQVTIVSVKKV